MLPESLESLAEKLTVFPGVGKRSGLKLALDMLQLNDSDHQALVRSLEEVKEKTTFCSNCGFFAQKNSSQEEVLCEICSQKSRNKYQICLVEKPTDIISVEKSNIYNGHYHVLRHLISPLDNIFPEDTTVSNIFEKRVPQLLDNPTQKIELILFLKAGFAAEATTAYLKEIIAHKGLKDKISVTRLAQGLPLYYNTDTLDQATMAKALEDRRSI
jgi:recombination protein RecR